MFMDTMLYLILLICASVCIKDSVTQNCDFSNDECGWTTAKGFMVTSYSELLKRESDNGIDPLVQSNLGENKGEFLQPLS